MFSRIQTKLPRKIKELARGLVRSAGVAHFENEVIGSLYRPQTAPDDPAAFVFHDEQRTKITGKDGLPIPPRELRMGYAQDDNRYVSSGLSTSQALRLALSDHSVSLEPGSAILDWGSTTGRVLRGFAKEAELGEAWGCDIDAPSIEWARANLSPPFRFVTGTTFPRLPFCDEKFRFIYGISVFTHIEHLLDAWLLEMHRLLEPDGCAIFTIHDEHTVQYFQEHGRPEWMPSSLSWEAVLEHEVTVVRGDRWSRTYTFFRDDYVSRSWGRFMTVAEIRPQFEGYQSAVVLRKDA